MKKIIFWELILIFASVLFFRSLWIFLDGVAWFQEPAGIFVSMGVGLALAGWALFKIHSK